jgi:hypothetical protein
VDAWSEEGFSIVSGSEESLGEGSDSRMEGSSGDGCFEEEAFLMNRPDESLGGSLGCFGMQ